MTLNEFKQIGKFKQKQLALIFGVKRQTIARWLEDETKITKWVKLYLELL